MTNYSAHLPLSRRGLLVSSTALLLLSGCGGLIGPSNPPPQIYVLEPDLHGLSDVPEVSWQLAVGTPDASESLDATRIALHRGAAAGASTIVCPLKAERNVSWTGPRGPVAFHVAADGGRQGVDRASGPP